MQFETCDIPDVVKVTPKRISDSRGSFSEVFRQDLFERAGIAQHFVQHNQSRSSEAGTIRGLHFQLAPAAQGKLVRVLSGAILDVAVDLRAKSPTYGKHVAVVLTAEEGTQLWVPVGFAHGFCTLEPNTEVFYSVTSYYSPKHDRGLLWCDPALGIPWPIPQTRAILADKDKKQPVLAELKTLF